MQLTNNLRKYFFLSIAHFIHTVPYIAGLVCDICIELCRISSNQTLSALCMLLKLLAAHSRKVRIRLQVGPIPMQLDQYPRVAVEDTDGTVSPVMLLSRYAVSKHQLSGDIFNWTITVRNLADISNNCHFAENCCNFWEKLPGFIEGFPVFSCYKWSCVTTIDSRKKREGFWRGYSKFRCKFIYRNVF